VVSVEEALPEEVAGTSEVAKKITESALEMADRPIQTGYAVGRRPRTWRSRFQAVDGSG
jgi:hypothetical protein